MKLLLTSAGITNQSIANALFSLTGKKPEDTTLVYIPTASNVETGDKGWLIDDLLSLNNLNFKSIEITDISAVDENIWRPSLEQADVLFFEGGNTYYLMEWLDKSGLAEVLPGLLKEKVYVGVSAGSMVTNKDLLLKISQIVYGEDLDKDYEMQGLNFVDFYFLPHLNSEYFINLREDFVRKAVKDMTEKIYVMDDNSALKVVDGKVEVIGEGEWFEIN
ncbi:Type 1 glutamine amidotransferase-like domain-containing protein [Candidatus Parcubacteria bacterium]|nr:Type 1 glutamine amidotransferase-like domain-containing protein [Patescibacteria group bacterium]MBU4309331.1 Type 1 glutamine amidotransferase-like domain-containing protein [Patescibacteria group bacterium]MBU4432308.1 Type 1 glutamine amidotransferase-like domain-containing protein [Patescibacteria group bacterium]MBU4577692.1 Type 1 glutamine amidotransferase-like domain-containing protein [Patescibacteria group bacterium]MCG2697378.1 Type 1 glutamine amidotransferase-like domain-contai